MVKDDPSSFLTSDNMNPVPNGTGAQGVLVPGWDKQEKADMMQFRTFSNPRFLEQIGRGTLALLLAQFAPEFAHQGVALPAESLDDEAYYQQVARLPEAPERLMEALHGIEVMATERGRERLSQAIQASRLEVERRGEATHAEFATQVLLVQPELFAQQQEAARITGLTSFEYYGSVTPEDRSATFTPPAEATLQRMRADIDSWLAAHRDSEERVTDMEVFPHDGEWVFFIRRGDACRRLPVVEGQRVMMRQFRPARDLVAAYCPQRDELRLHGRSAREKQLIREVFGWRLFGDLRRFESRRAFTLEPLRALGPDALEAPVGSGIERVELRGLEVHREEEVQRVEKTDEHGAMVTVPDEGRLMRASFLIRFRGQRRARPVHLYAGNQLRMSRHCDATAVHRWLTERGFRTFNHGWTPMNMDGGGLWE